MTLDARQYFPLKHGLPMPGLRLRRQQLDAVPRLCASEVLISLASVFGPSRGD